MSGLINKMLNFVGWESEGEEEPEDGCVKGMEEQLQPPQLFQTGTSKKQQNKVVNIHSSSQFKVVVMQPENFDDARDICDHLKNKKPVVINLEDLQKECAQRIVDFLSGAVYSLDGEIQKVSSGIFIIAPSNVDIMGEFRDEFKNKGVFPWVKQN